MSQENNQTEVARLLEKIEMERLIIRTALEELAERKEKYRFLARCLEKKLGYQRELIPLVGEQQAQVLVEQLTGEP